MTDEQSARVAKALTDPKRLAIMERIAADEEIGCQSLLKSCLISQATVSHHIRSWRRRGWW